MLCGSCMCVMGGLVLSGKIPQGYPLQKEAEPYLIDHYKFTLNTCKQALSFHSIVVWLNFFFFFLFSSVFLASLFAYITLNTCKPALSFHSLVVWLNFFFFSGVFLASLFAHLV